MRISRFVAAGLFVVAVVLVVDAQPPRPMFGGPAFINGLVLSNKVLQEELKVTDSQKEKFKTVADKQSEMYKKQFEAFKDAAGDMDRIKEIVEKNKKTTEKLQDDIKKVVEDTLTTEQKTRLKQIERQIPGVRAVLSEDTLRLLGNLERAQIEQRVRRIFDLWARGDVDAVIAEMSPDVKMATNGEWLGVAAPAHGRPAAAAYLRKMCASLENIVSVLHEIVIDGDRAVVHRTSVGRWRESGRRYQCDFIDIFRFRDSLVSEFSEYPDPGWIEAQTEV